MSRRWSEADYQAYEAKRRAAGHPKDTPQEGRKNQAATVSPRPKKKVYPLLDDRPNTTQATLVGVLGVELGRAFPGVFVPIEDLGIQWGNAELRLGVNVCGWTRAGFERDGWHVLVVTPRHVVDHVRPLVDLVREIIKGRSLEQEVERYER